MSRQNSTLNMIYKLCTVTLELQDFPLMMMEENNLTVVNVCSQTYGYLLLLFCNFVTNGLVLKKVIKFLFIIKLTLSKCHKLSCHTSKASHSKFKIFFLVKEGKRTEKQSTKQEKETILSWFCYRTAYYIDQRLLKNTNPHCTQSTGKCQEKKKKKTLKAAQDVLTLPFCQLKEYFMLDQQLPLLCYSFIHSRHQRSEPPVYLIYSKDQ